MGERLFGLARTVVLARILAPTDFGLIGISMLAISTLELFSQSGFQAALIQRRGRIERYLDTAWSFSVLRGMFLCGLVFFTAPAIARFFQASNALPILRVMGITLLVRGLTSPGVIFFQRELEFRKQFSYEFSGTIADLIVAMGAAFILRNVWAMVFGILARDLVRVVSSYIIHPYRPRPSLERQEIGELFGFGRWIFASSIVNFLNTQGDDAFIGKVLGAGALGFYQMAYTISNLPATEVSHVISQVTYPVYSKLQDRLPKLRSAYLETFQVTTFLSLPVSVGIISLAPDFVEVFLGSKWHPIVPAMRILALWGLLRSMGATTGPLFQALGKPAIMTKLQFGKLVLLAILIYPLTIRWGIVGTAMAVVFNAILLNPIGEYLAIRILDCHPWKLAKLFLLPAIGSFAMGAGIFALRHFVPQTMGFPTLLGMATLAILIYLSTMAILEAYADYGLTKIFLERLNAVANGG